MEKNNKYQFSNDYKYKLKFKDYIKKIYNLSKIENNKKIKIKSKTIYREVCQGPGKGSSLIFYVGRVIKVSIVLIIDTI